VIALALVFAPAVTFAQAVPPPVTPAAPARAYRLAFTGGLAVGKPEWASTLGGISEVAARVQALPWLGIGLSYFQLGAGNNEDYDPFTFEALEISASWRPVVGRWFDPFVQVGTLAVIDSGGGYPGDSTSPFGLEGMAGFDFVRLPLAVGVHLRSGFTSESWTLLGLHLEVRI